MTFSTHRPFGSLAFVALCLAVSGQAVGQVQAAAPTAASVQGQAAGAPRVPDTPRVAGATPLAAADAVSLRLLGLSSAEPELAAFYAARGGRPVWAPAGGDAPVAPLVAALAAAPSHGLPQARHGIDGLSAATAQAAADPIRAADLDLALSRALARYAGDMAAGLLRPSRVDRDIHLFPPRPTASDLLDAAAAAPDLAAWLAALEPAEADYQALRALYAEFLARVEATPADAVRLAEGGTLRQGDASPRVAALRDRLAAEGHAAAPTDRPDRFDAGLAAAVRDFQTARGLNADGVAGRMTLTALGADARERLRQVAVALERRRWGPRHRGERHIWVNLPDFSMQLVEGGRVVHASRAVVGTTSRQTQEFSDEMTYLVVNPTWHVPRSIATRDILPILRDDPSYLSRQNMRLVRADGGAVPIDAAAHDFTAYSQASFPYRIRQAPGPANSLWRVKFMFPNEFNIYLHDTPTKSLFRRDSRAYSSGCVRVEDPFRLAHLLIEGQVDDPEAAFQRWLDAGRERHVTLARPLAVHLVYRTVWVEADGAAQFRPDIYGRDARVWAALEAEGLDLGL